MKRLQTYLLLVWTVFTVLFLIFNWDLAWRPTTVTLLFVDFDVALVFWLVVGTLLLALLLRWMSVLGARAFSRRMDHLLDQVKSEAHVQRSAELEGLIERLEDRLKAALGEPVEDKPATAGKSPEDAAEQPSY